MFPDHQETLMREVALAANKDGGCANATGEENTALLDRVKSFAETGSVNGDGNELTLSLLSVYERVLVMELAKVIGACDL